MHQSNSARTDHSEPPLNERGYVPYPAYKDSGIEWLGEIPTHWAVTRIKRLLLENDSGVWGSDFDDEGVIVLRSTEQTVSGEWDISTPAKRRLTALEHASYRLEEGDLLITTSSGSALHIGKTTIVSEEVADLDCCFSNFMQRLRVKENTFPRFLWRFFNGRRRYLDYLAGTTTGLANLSGKIIEGMAIALPPLPEQRAITTFLDRETVKIDMLVEKQERLIDLLQERRVALISHAVTKGLDPNVPMKDSGIEWLGEIPEHWEVKRLKRLLAEALKYGANEPADCTNPDFPRYIRITDIQENGTLRDDSFKSIPENLAHPYLLVPGDMLFARSGSIGMTFRYDSSWGRAAFAGYLIRARFNEETEPAFIDYFTQSRAYKLWLLSSCIQTTIQNVSAERYANMSISIPPYREQREIMAFLDCEIAKIDGLIAKIHQVVKLQKELRSALISAAVTGKIDIRQTSVSTA